MTDLEQGGGGATWRGAVSGAAGLVWLVGLLVWWAFLSEGLTVAQRFAVAILSLMVLATLMALLWVPHAMRWGPEEDRRRWAAPGFVPRMALSVVLVMTLAGLASYLLYFPWRDLDLCQSLVVIVVAVVAGAVTMAPLWMGWERSRRGW